MSTFNPDEYQKLKSRHASIQGLIEFDLVVNKDSRGWFKENYQKEKLDDLGLPKEFQIVQNNISFNEKAGVTRGIHAEPWDKFISIASGAVFAAIVDLRPGDNFGKVESFELNPGKAIYVPRGCGNSYQTLEDQTVYTYLVNEYWYPEAKYIFVNLADPDLAIKWPIPLSKTDLSEKDRNHPLLKDIITERY